MRTRYFLLNFITILSVVALLLGFTASPVSAGSGKDLQADPRLVEMAKANPAARFSVIIQKREDVKILKGLAIEKEIRKGGGKVKNQWKMITSFSAELAGKEILRLARHPQVRWISADAPVVSMGGPGMESVRDDFQAPGYSGNSGTVPWSTGWIEGDALGDALAALPDAGVVRVAQSNRCAGGSGTCLQIAPDTVGSYVYREANLSGSVSVWLSFHRNNQLNASLGGALEQVLLQVSPDGGATWTTLSSYTGVANLGAATDSFDISAYASAKTRIRFITPVIQVGTRYLYIDDLEISYAQPSAFLSAVKADQLALDGQGITVAVIDSGINVSSPEFMSGSSSRIVGQSAFGSLAAPGDEHGHGTHVAGIIGGNGVGSGGKYRGLAPGVNLINLRVADQNGMTHESDVLDSLEWVYNNRETHNIRIVNLSLNSTVAQSYHTSPLSAAVETLWFNGVVVVVSAGNNGTGTGPVTIYPPANDPFVITVGAAEDRGTATLGDDRLAVFSAYNMTEDGFQKPDLVAPGRNVIAPLAGQGSTIYLEHARHRIGGSYFRMSGTSMSAPVVTGAIALLLQAQPHLNPDQVKYRLMATANRDWPGFDAAQAGAGYLDVTAVVNGSSTESANIGLAVSQMLMADGTSGVWTGTTMDASASSSVGWNSVGWNSVGWNSVGWNSVGWNSVGWNSVGWNSVGWNSVGWNSVGWNSVGWNSNIWDD